MSESDLVARTRQLLADPVPGVGWGHLGQATITDENALLEFVFELRRSALPALLADNERLTAEIERVSTIRDGAIEVGLAMTSERDIAIARADAAEARLTQLTEALTQATVPGVDSGHFGQAVVTDEYELLRFVAELRTIAFAAAALVVSETGQTE